MTAVNLSSFAGAGAQFLDDNASPLSGGLVYTYLAGTTTPATTYTSNSGATPNANPIVLDAAGRCPNEIWLPIGVLYKFVVKTSASVLIGTYDTIPAINDPYSINSVLGSITGTNAIAAAATPTITSYATGATYSFIAANSNTAATTISIDGLAAKSITKNGSAALSAGDIQAGKLTWIEYDGSTFQLLNNIVYGGSITNGTIVSLTAPVPVAAGGTGLATITAGSILIGNGVAAVGTIAPGVIGTTPVSNGTAFVAKGVASAVLGARKGLKVNTTSTTAGAITAEQLVLSDGTNALGLSTISLSLSISTTGINALDTGTVAASTWYSVWVIYNPTTSTTAGLLSTSATAPTLPSGYTFKTRVGWFYVGAASTLIQTIQYDNRAQYIATATGFPILKAGSGTQWTAVAVSTVVPSTASSICLLLGIANNVAAAAAVSANSAPTALKDGFMYLGGNASYPNSITMNGVMTLESTNIYYYGASATAANNFVNCSGWIDSI